MIRHLQNRFFAGFAILLAATLLPFSAAAQQDGVPIRATLTVSRNPVYVNETFYVTLSIITMGVQFRQTNLNDLPEKGHLDLYGKFEDLPVQRTGSGPDITEIHRYRCAARSTIPGTITIAPTLNITVMQRQRGFIGSYWRQQRIQLKIPQTTLTTLALPPPPPDFSGAVGKVRLKASIYPDDIVPGDLVTLTTRITGATDSPGLKIPQLKQSPLLKVYPPEEVKGSGPEIVHTQVVIPQSTNLTAIPKISIVYFDTDTRDYRRVSAGPWPLKYHQQEKLETSHYVPSAAIRATNRPVKAATAPAHRRLQAAIIKAGEARYQKMVCPDGAEARLAPSTASLKTFSVSPGAKVLILDNYKEWYKVDADKRIGWIPAAALQPEA